MTTHQVNIGARVKSSDGKNLGKIEKLIVRTPTGRVDGFLLDKGIFDASKIVAAGQVASTGADGIVLKLDAQAAETLPNEIHEQMLRAPGSLTYGGGMGGMVDVQGTGSQWMVRGESGGQLPHTGSGSFYAQAPIGNVEVQNLSNLPEDAIIVSEGTEVVGSDYKKIGHLDEVFLGEDRCVTSFLVRSGWLFKHDLRLPIALVAGASHKHVRLNVTANEAGQHAVTGDS